MATKKVYIDRERVLEELKKIGVSDPDKVADTINSKVKALISEYKDKPITRTNYRQDERDSGHQL